MAANYRIIGNVFNWTADYLRSLCMWMKCMIGSLMDSEQKQPQRVTFEEECQKTYVQADKSTREDLMSEDTVDLSTNDSVIEALESVSEAIYTKCISSWHCPPEDKKEQPLFKELNGGICGIYFNIKAKVRPLEEYDILIAVANSVISHLKNFRKKRETHKNYTPKEEVDFLRKQTHSLLSYWLPDSLRNSDFILVFLKEIISINVLQPSLNMLADPTFINETIVRTLGGEAVNKEKDLKLGSAPSEPCASTCILESDCATNRKKKKNKIFRKMKGLVTRTNSKKHEEHGDNSRFRSYSGTENKDTFDCTDGFTEQISSDEFGEDEPVSTVNETILQKWEEENWTARICESPTKDRPTYKICVSKDGAKLWITERSVKDFKQINSIICEKYPDLEAFTNLEQNEEEELEDSDFFQVHGTDPDTFINALLEVIKLHHDPEPIFFFSPFNYEEEVRELFSIVFLDNEVSNI